MFNSRLFLLAAFLPGPLAAQIIGGRVVDSASRRPLVDVKVTATYLDSNVVVIDRPTDSTGVFYIHLVGPGAYQLRFDLTPTTHVLRDTFFLADSSFLEREFILAVPVDPVFNESQVDSQPRVRRPGFEMRYPVDLYMAGVQGTVLVAYVVDKRGIVEPASIAILQSNDPRFSYAVIKAVKGMRLKPAQFHGKPVRQYVEQPFIFCISETEPGGMPTRCLRGLEDRRNAIWILAGQSTRPRP
jgi:TonB family protein